MMHETPKNPENVAANATHVATKVAQKPAAEPQDEPAFDEDDVQCCPGCMTHPTNR